MCFCAEEIPYFRLASSIIFYLREGNVNNALLFFSVVLYIGIFYRESFTRICRWSSRVYLKLFVASPEVYDKKKSVSDKKETRQLVWSDSENLLYSVFSWSCISFTNFSDLLNEIEEYKVLPRVLRYDIVNLVFNVDRRCAFTLIVFLTTLVSYSFCIWKNPQTTTAMLPLSLLPEVR
jgi:hypothetical protein